MMECAGPVIAHETTFSLGHVCCSKAGLVEHLLLGNNVCRLAMLGLQVMDTNKKRLVSTSQNGGFCDVEEV